MKLSLPRQLRKFVTACMVAASLTLASGIFHQAAFAAEIEYNPVSDIPEATWSNSAIGQYIFNTGDSVSFFKPAVITLVDNIQASVVNVREHSELVLIGEGNSLNATRGIDLGMNSILTLRDNALAAATKLTQSSGALVRLDWGDITSSIDTSLAQYRGAIAVRNSTFNTTPTTAMSWGRVVMEGSSTLQLGNNAELTAPITLMGDHVIQVASGTAALEGEISGYGTITKTGTGTLYLGPNNEVHSGELVIDAGTVQWGAKVADGSKQYQDNTLAFRKIVVNAGATFEDSHMGVNLEDITDIVLKDGGKMMAYDMQNPRNTNQYYGLMENVYHSLTVDGAGTMDFQFKGARRFLTLTGTGTLTINNGTQQTHTRFNLIKDFNGTINGEAKNDNNRLVIDKVDLAEGITLNINQNLYANTITKVGAGTLNVTGNLTADGDLKVMNNKLMTVTGTTTVTNAILSTCENYTNNGNFTARGYFFERGSSVTISGTLTTGSNDVTGFDVMSAYTDVSDPDNPFRNNKYYGKSPALELINSTLTVGGVTTATGIIHIANNSTAQFNSDLTALRYGTTGINYASDLRIEDNSKVSVGRNLQLGSISASSSSSLDVTGTVTVRRDVSFASNSKFTAHSTATIGGALTLNGGSVFEGGGALTAGSISVAGNSSLSSPVSIATDVLDLASGSIGTKDLTVRKMLTMDYTGDLQYGDIMLGKDAPFNKDIVLSYASGRANTLKLTTEELNGMNVIYADVSRVSAEDLAKGIDLGITKSAVDKLSIAQLTSYTLDTSGSTVKLFASSTAPVLPWDSNWGIIEMASAPKEIKSESWAIIAEKEGLYKSQYYDNNSYLIAANATTGEVTAPTAPRRSHLLYGGAYGTQPVDAEGGNIYRDIWLNIAGGRFTMVTGGSACEPNVNTQSGSMYPWNIVGDTHIQVTKDIGTIGTVIGSNFLDGNNPTHTGDSYISIYSLNVTGSIIGSSTHVTWNRTYYGITVPTNGTIRHDGNTNIFIYTNLPMAQDTDVYDRSLTEVSEGLISSICANAVIGGTHSSYDTQTSIINGNTNVTFDFKDLQTSGNITVKSAVAGHWGTATQQQTGDSNITFRNVQKGASFNGDVYSAGHYICSTNQQRVRDGAETNNFERVNQTQTGDGNFVVTDSRGVRFGGIVVGGHGVYGDHRLLNTAATQTRSGNTLLMVNNSDGTGFGDTVTAGHYWMTNITPEGEVGERPMDQTLTQTHTGNTTFLLNKAKQTSFSGDAACGGSYVYLASDDTSTVTQQNTGKIEYLILDSPGVTSSAVMVGAHYAFDNIDEPAADPQTFQNRTTLIQTHAGDTVMSVVNSQGCMFNNNFVAGNYATGNAAEDRIPYLQITQSQTGNTYLNIIDVGNTSFTGEWLVGGHFTDAHVQNTVTQTHETGSVFMNINSGSFSNTVVGGDVMAYNAIQQTWTSSFTGDINFNFSNAAFRGMVIGGSYNESGTRNTFVNDINIDIVNSSLSNEVSLIGGDYITGNGNSSIRDITINLKGADVSGDIYGGSWIRGGNTALGVNQGDIKIRIEGGRINNDIYAAGRQDGEQSGGVSTMVTSSTRVDLDDKVQLAKITVSGGYLSQAGYRMGSIVTGNRTLAFSTPGSAYENIKNVTFIYFDTVEVAEGSLVTLNENLQLLDNAVTKTGLGTLDIYHTNDLDTVMVREGRLRLAANSAQTSMIEHLSVEKGAQLDITKGGSGINGIVTMAEGSTLICTVNQNAPTVTNVDWQGKVNLWVDGVTPAVSEGGYCIPLFHADDAHGLYQADVTGIELGVVTGIEGLATRADAYVNSVTPGFVTDGAYLVLRDNTLYLTNKEAPARYWLGPSGHWNDTDKVWSQSPTQREPLTTYEEGARTFFIAQDSTPVEVTLDKDVDAFSVTVRNGAFEFHKGDGDTINLTRGDLVVQNGSALIHPEVKFSEYSGIDVQADSTLTMDGNKAVTVYNLSNSGEIELGDTPLTVKNLLQSSGTIHAGNVTLGHGTAQGGTLAAKDVKLGGDTAFTKLTANNVTGNGGYTLTVNGPDESYIKSLDGGSLRVDQGSLVIDQPGATVLTSLQGTGTLTTPGTITLQQPSAIGNLTASGVTVGSTLDVANNLAADSITLQFASLQRPSVTAHDIQSVTPDASVDVHADSSIFTYLYPVEGKEYYLVQAGKSTSSPLTVNGHPDSETVRANRYEYTLSVVNDGVKMNGKIVDYHYYRDQALSENGKSGANMLDTLFTGDDLEKIQNKSPNGTIMQILHRMDQLAQARDRVSLDHLAAAVGGAAIAPVSLAFNDDINRQLRAMRNRTTVMGLPACEVHNNLPYVNAWVNAEANFINFGDNGTYSGYDLKSWGGTVGADIDFTNSFTAALAVTAMRGSYQASCAADNCDGDLDTMYVSLMGRYARRAWTHTFVATLGFADVSMDRKVNQAGIQYGTKGDTTGTGFGFMYELGYTRAIGRRTSLQPVLNFTYAHASIGGYEETGNEAALKVDDMAYNTFTIGAGARIQSATDPDTYENSVLFEGRALLKVITGDTQAQADVAMVAARRAKASMKAEEAGNFGLELGGGVSVPLNSGNSFIFADVSAEIRSGYTNVNGTLGYRINF